MNGMIAARPIAVQRLCIHVAKSGIARVRRGMAPVPRIIYEAYSGLNGCRGYQAREL